MRQIPWLVLLLPLLFAAAGCSILKKPVPQPVAPVSAGDFYERADAEALLQFGESFAHAAPAERQQECKRLLQLESSKPVIGVRLHLFMAQLLLAECGEVSKNVETIKTKLGDVKDDDARRLFIYTEQLLGRLNGEIEQRKSVERQLRVTNQRVQSTNRQMKTRESELKSLQDKLDALKSIEQNLGGSQDGN